MLLQKIREGGFYGLSFVFTSVVIANAFNQKKQFYPAVVYLTKSNPSLAILAVQALVFVILLGKLTRKVFFGSLRAAEVEHLIERSWYAVTETCLAFTVFRDDFNVVFVAMFTMLLFFKCFHWLAEDRVDYMERSPLLGCLFHSRMLGLMTTLAALDCYFIKQAYLTTLMKGASAQLVFGFEYAILLTIVFTIFIKYLLHCIDLNDENPWENKAVYLLYLELITNGWKFLLYTVFVALMSKVHTFPLFAIRPLYLTMRSFKKALADVILSRRAISNMNQLYPDATEEDLQTVDDCIICRDPMSAQGGCKKLPCAHIFHASCLRSWFQRQQTCPTCRMEVLNVPAAPTAPAAPAQPAAAAAPAAAAPAPPAHVPWQAMHAQLAGARHGRPQAPPTAPPAGNAPGQANPNVQPPAPPVMPGFPVGFPPGFPAMPAMPHPAAAGAQGAAPPGAMPPPPFPGMFPFMAMPPPQMPQANIQALTEDQLRQMELDERGAVEARIQWLRDIQTLIDSAVEQLHQYTLVMSALNASRPPVRRGNVGPTTAPPRQSDASNIGEAELWPTPPTHAPARSEHTGHDIPSRSPLSGVTTLTSKSEGPFEGARPKTISPASPTTSSPPGANSGAPSASPTNSLPEFSLEQEEIRRRRLAKFQQPQQEENKDSS